MNYIKKKTSALKAIPITAMVNMILIQSPFANEVEDIARVLTAKMQLAD